MMMGSGKRLHDTDIDIYSNFRVKKSAKHCYTSLGKYKREIAVSLSFI
jgi:hypothetical protein